jgi:hypothetical protein
MEPKTTSTLTLAMNTLKPFSTFIWRGIVAGIFLATISLAHAQTFWTGSSITFTNPGNGATDTLVPNVILTRRTIDNGGGLYNAANETAPTKGISPAGTTWSKNPATLAAYMANPTNQFGPCPLEGPFGNPAQFDGVTWVVHLVTNNIYLQLKLNSWGGQGGFPPLNYSYTRSTPVTVGPPPTISITSPANGSVFAAPASEPITANATVSSGVVTNVQFFTNNISVGNITTGPFTLTPTLAAGNYALTAAATAAGISTTSSAVNISVVTPIAVTLTNPTTPSNTGFQFTYSANVGLSYVINRATDLVSGVWVPIATNVAASNPTNFVDIHATNSPAFYRVGRLPNP